MKSKKQYFDFKSFYSIVLFALVDASYQFIWESIGAPQPNPQRILGTRVSALGNAHVSTYFQSTDLWRRISKGDTIPEETCVVNNLNIPPIVFGDGRFVSIREHLVI